MFAMTRIHIALTAALAAAAATFAGPACASEDPVPKLSFCLCDQLQMYEYVHTATGHYFVTASSADVEALESGRIPGWVRTDTLSNAAVWNNASTQYWQASQVGQPSPVCRFFIPPDDHFISADAKECETVAVTHPEYVLESSAAFYAWLPNQAGVCPVDQINFPTDNFFLVPMFRLWNNAANHRYTTSPAIRDQMIAEGWTLEGYGTVPAVMCVLWNGSQLP
jgi:hypothetical protein